MADLRLGGQVDPATHQRSEAPATVRAEDLTTHGVIVGMTGSGKTGLGIVLVEECLRAGIPALLIDPKGDLTNLALTFPDLAPAQFEPWVSASAAAKAGQDVGAFAAAEAQRWSAGLAGWALGAPDVRGLHDAADVAIYTPGAPHGINLNILGALDAPDDLGDPQGVSEQIDAYVSSLLNLLQIDADPLSSREHILLATIINDAWAQGRSLDLATLVASVQRPPMRKVGVLDLDTYYPPGERMKLALRLNGLLASPAFAAWLDGERIDIEAMLRTPDGRPRCAVVTTAHLSDEQRQSVTSVLLAALIAWMRRQPGTADLRALLYMDEVAGYLPPVGNPPTKEPVLLLLKQARAFGVGVVLSTQNPVDVDYKALSNAGTWLVGRLQTEQDKARLLDGLTSAAGTVDPRAVSDTISGLAKREFLLKRASRDDVEVLTTRWAMSYLRGPLTRDQIASLAPAPTPSPAPPAPPAEPAAQPAPRAVAVESGASAPGFDITTVGGRATTAGGTPAGGTTAGGTPAGGSPDATPVPPTVADGVPVRYLDPAASWAASVGAVPGSRLVPGVIARVQMRFDEKRADLVHDQEYEAVLVPIPDSPRPEDFRAVDYDDRDLIEEPPAGARYELPPSAVATKTWWRQLQRDLREHLYRSMALEIPRNAELKLYGRVGESPDEFAERARAAAADAADRQVAALAAKYERRIADVERRLLTAQQTADRRRATRTSTLASDVIGSIFGARRSVSASMRRATTAQRRVAAAEDKVDELERTMADLQADLDAEVGDIRADWARRAEEISTMPIGLERSDVTVTGIGLVWVPAGV